MLEMKTKLLPHQEIGVQKLKKVKVCALFMEMGTGKTRTMLELIKLRLDKKKVNHILWLCPCTVKESLKLELKKHLVNYDDTLFTICGIETLSSSIKTNVKLRNLVENNKVYLIVDESTKVKNFNALRTQNIISLAEKCEYKAVLNGTPITKNEADLFSQFYILDSRILGYSSFYTFARYHITYDSCIPNKIKSIKYVDYITTRIAPYVFEVKKNDCLNLKNKFFFKKRFWLTSEQENHYQEIANKLFLELDEMKPNTVYNLFYALQSIACGFHVSIDNYLDKEQKISREPFFIDPKENPRNKALLKTIETDIKNSKVIICCTFLNEVNEIEKILDEKFGTNSYRTYTGSCNLKTRQKKLEDFEHDSSVQFLIATKTTVGFGLNLQFANNIIYYSNDWNYGTRSQSEDRIHRLGQTKDVNIYDIIAEDTIDVRINRCLDKKENILKVFLELIKEKKINLKKWLSTTEEDKKE
ncbi:DEAD/DEAH box helicase [uncultured Sneathia sp.]|uniref:helicase-related protein n=1 Tax=uncultured Sneathia sp. TaxID=278067 RepID=UPI002595FBA5|nr:DEAD/DEAH box helicase [uncultured Sneathia sp.]